MRPKIDLAAAVAAAEQHQAAPLTFKELVLGFNTSSAGDYDWRLKKWIEAFGQTPAWDISSELLENATAAMLKAGYKPGTVNRDLSAIGTCYKWAKRQRLTPKGFRSPTLGVSRYNEGRVHDRSALERACCECYDYLKTEMSSQMSLPFPK